jgi:leucyl aminopeptidase
MPKIVQEKSADKKSLKVNFVNKAEVKLIKKNDANIRMSEFTGSKNEIILSNGKLFVGVEDIEKSLLSNSKVDKDNWRVLGFNLSKKLISLNVKIVSMNVGKKSAEFIEGLFLGLYKFNTYKSQSKTIVLKKIELINKSINLTKLIDRIERKVSAQNLTRDWVNLSGEDANSNTIYNAVVNNFLNSNVLVEKISKSEMEKLGMNGHLAVNQASNFPALTIKLTYEPKDYQKEILLIGKGITYDTGGLSLKPTSAMLDMKMDKAGAMTVLGIFDGLNKLNDCTNKVVGYMAIAENALGSNAYRPGDVLEMMNKKTVIVKNTDAEGRLVLFDNICLAEEQNPNYDEMFSFATLTGSAVVQFGSEVCGMVGFNNKMKKRVQKVGRKKGELFENASFHKYMLNAVDDTLADLSNTGTPNQGCQKAGLFLTKAVKEENLNKFLHLDIAGPAFSEKGFGSNSAGGTGFAVRTFIDYLTK